MALLGLMSSVGLSVEFAGDVAVGQESFSFLVVVLHGGLFDEFAFIVELAEEVGSRLVVYFRRSTSIDVERDAELLERVADQRMVAVYHVLGCTAFLLGTDGDGHTVLVASADEDDVLLLEAQVAHVDVGGDVDAGQVTDVDRAVGIGQGRCHGSTFKLFLHIVVSLYVTE